MNRSVAIAHDDYTVYCTCRCVQHCQLGPAKLRDLIRIRIGRSDSIQFESDEPIRKFSNRPRLPIARRSQTTQTIKGAY